MCVCVCVFMCTCICVCSRVSYGRFSLNMRNKTRFLAVPSMFFMRICKMPQMWLKVVNKLF